MQSEEKEIFPAGNAVGTVEKAELLWGTFVLPASIKLG